LAVAREETKMAVMAEEREEARFPFGPQAWVIAQETVPVEEEQRC
jgi:hypothetical protein